MSDDVALPLEFTDAAANKVKSLIADEDNPNLKLRVYITGGGCSGFQYGFTFDDQVNEGDVYKRQPKSVWSIPSSAETETNRPVCSGSGAVG